MQIENTSINTREGKLDEIIDVAAEEIAKHVNICNENGHLVMKVKDSENINLRGMNSYSIRSDKKFTNKLYEFDLPYLLIDVYPRSHKVKNCTIPTGVKLLDDYKGLSAVYLEFGQQRPLIYAGNVMTVKLDMTNDGFCRLVQEKINDMQTGANVNQNNNTNTINTNTNSTNTDNSMDDKTIDEVLEYINGNVRSDVQSGHGDNKNQGKKKKKSKKHKKKQKGNNTDQNEGQNINQVEDQKEEPKKKDLNVSEKQRGHKDEPKEDPKVVEKHEDQREDQKEDPKVEEKSTNNTAPKENLINTAEEPINQIVVEEPQIEQPLNNDVPQNAETQNGPNFIARPVYCSINREYDHFLQEAGQYYTNNWQLSRNQIHQHAGSVGQTPLPVPHPANSWKGYYTQHDQQNQTRLNLKAKPFHPKGK